MRTNTFLRQLGFEKTDRVVIIHADDVGMCQANVTAFTDLFESGSISSGAVMVPCPWFLQVAAYCSQNPKVDMGVHLTLTSEWSTYRWRPISTCDPTTGLLDDEGYFHHRVHQVQEHGNPRAVEFELKSQIIRAKESGIKVTHIDSHMGSLAHPKFLPTYIKLSQLHNLPAMIPVGGQSDWQALGLDIKTAAKAAHFVREKMDMKELLPIDYAIGLRLDQPQERLAQARSAFDSLQPGLTHLSIHPAYDTPELRAATPSTWQCRVGDYEVFRSEELHNHIKNLGIHIIGYETLQQLM